MKIGIYIPDVKPQAGGASSLLKTIKNEILASNSEDNFYFIYNGGGKTKYKIQQDNFAYFNLDVVRPSFFFRALRKILSCVGIQLRHRKSFPFNWIAEKEMIDLFWITFPCAIDIDYPCIYTVWDLGHRSVPFFPEVSRSGLTWNSREAIYQKMIYKASYILTGNQTGKKEILENYSVRPDSIRIAEFPVASFCFGKQEKPSFDIDGDYFFYPAQFWPHKNHIRIIQALSILKTRYKECPTVVFSGSDKGNKDYIVEMVKQYNLESQVIFAGFISDEQMKYLYTHARAMVFASLLGPNNMPPIEATYLGCPVIITDLEGHREQLKDTALYFNGIDADDLALSMHKMLKNDRARKSLLQKQKKLAKSFAKINYFDVVQEIINEFRYYRETWGEDFINR